MDQAPISDLVDLRGRTAIVTGGVMGIGQAVARRVWETGAHVIVADADREAGEATAKRLGARGLGATAVQTFVAPELDMDTADFHHVVAVKLRGVFLCCKYVSQHFVGSATGGQLINVTSVDALHPSMVGLAAYDASKHAVWGFTKNLALELAPHGIWVNAVAPGGILNRGVMRMQSEDGAHKAAGDPRARIPMGRLGGADDIARVVLFLASDLYLHMTGAQVVVDGGMLLG